MQSKKSQPEGQQIMLEMRFAELHMTNHPVMSVVIIIAPLQVSFNKLAKPGFNVVVSIHSTRDKKG